MNIVDTASLPRKISFHCQNRPSGVALVFGLEIDN